ncbi:hypothetical protein OHA98_41475 [Streptomyces sp. NBC_00654]|uniref:hypothetical protein n=1 Tax=Streptomyces sp. NBC_00654 TaxID=2975799 RepID=UPI002252448E|nr:hypothetical protein [Streptomyces sp. NBC_00654]MCX4971085.1 hypothetical protein [Streptomyces sp. NBC_00654]
MRSRLGRSDEGRGALGLWDAEPGSEQAAEAVRARLTVELEGDPGLAEQLRAALQHGPPPVPTHPPAIVQRVHIGGDANRATINVGPLHLKKTTGVVATLAVIGVVLALLVTLGLRSVVQSLGDDEGERKVAPLSEMATVKSVLPDSDSLPAEFKSEGDPVVTTDEQGCQPVCKGLLFAASTTMGRERPQKTAALYVMAYDSAPHAAQAFEMIRREMADSSEKTLISFPSMGDTSTAYQFTPGNIVLNEDDESIEEAEAEALVGTVVVLVRYTTALDDLEPSLTALARMMADRAQQAQNGNSPSATASF